MKTSASSVKITTMLVHVEDAALVRLHLLRVRRVLQHGDEVVIRVEPLERHAVVRVAVAVVRRARGGSVRSGGCTAGTRARSAIIRPWARHCSWKSSMLSAGLRFTSTVSLIIQNPWNQWPPLTPSACPVTHFDRSDAKNTTDPAISDECGR